MHLSNDREESQVMLVNETQYFIWIGHVIEAFDNKCDFVAYMDISS